MSKLVDDNIEFAKLLSSVNTGKTGLQRQLSPIEVAQYIERLVDEEGMDTTLMLLPLETKLISDFRVLLTFPLQVQDGIIWGQTKDGGLGFSAAVFIFARAISYVYLISCSTEKNFIAKSSSIAHLKEFFSILSIF